jgi:thymidylate synthase
MKQYLDLVRYVLENGSENPTRATVAGVPVSALTVPFLTFRHDLAEGMPLLTTKKVGLRNVAAEVAFFKNGEHRKEDLWKRNCHIWDEWQAPGQPDPNELGRPYGVQWREWTAYDRESPGGMDMTFSVRQIDQLAGLVKSLKETPFDRRQVVTAWNPAELDQMALPPCHMIWNTTVTKRKEGTKILNLSSTMRSADLMLGVPYNIASYAILTHLLAKEAGMVPGILGIAFNNCHIYSNHIEGATEQLQRAPRALPKVSILDKADGAPFSIMDWDYKEFELTGYDPHPPIPFEVAV